MTNIEGGSERVDPSLLEDPQHANDALFFEIIYTEYSDRFPRHFIAIHNKSILLVEEDLSELNRRLIDEHNLEPDQVHIGQLLAREERDRLSREILVVTPFPTIK